MFQINTWMYSMTIAASAALVLTSCSHHVKNVETTPQVQVLPESAAPKKETPTHYTVLEFDAGKINLPASEQEKIKNLAKVAQQTGKVAEIRILAWDDDPEAKEPQLAAQRGTKVRSLVQEDLKSRAPVAIFNMSESPMALTELIGDATSNRKTTFENTESISFGKGPKSSLAGNKASKAIVLVRYE